MTDFTRRDFLKLAGAGTVAAAGSLATFRLVGASRTGDTFAFRAVKGLPEQPLPAYASYVLEGNVDLAKGAGVITRRVYAGAPEAMSSVLFDELTRTYSITGVKWSPRLLTLQAVLDGQAKLHSGESSSATIVVDQARSEVRAPFIGNDVVMKLEA